MITLLDGAPKTIGAKELEQALRREIRGDVRFEPGYRAMYSTDASNYRYLPIGVVMPRDAQDVIRTIALCNFFNVPVLSRGGGTGLSGSTCNAAVVLDYSKYMNAILDIDWNGKRARVQPGCVTDDLKARTQPRDLIFGPDPATHNRNTFGGMIGNNSCGVHAQMAGKCAENVEELEVLTFDGLRLRVGPTPPDELERIIAAGGRRGEIYRRLRDLRDRYADLIRKRFPPIPRRISGYGLDWLLPENGFNVARALVGTEGTCVSVLEATVRLVYSPPCRALCVLGFADLFAAADAVPRCDKHKPLALEGIDESLFEYMKKKGMPLDDRAMFPPGHAWLVVEFGGASPEEAAAKTKALLAEFALPHLHSAKTYVDEKDQARLWRMRDEALGATSKIPNEPDYYPGWEDSAVAPDRLGDYLRSLHALMKEYGYAGSLYGHFGQGCVHVSISFDLFTTEGIARYRSFVTRAARLCVEHCGSLSGEHGDGQARSELLPIMYGDELVEAFGEFKAIWDPKNRMNPGRKVNPRKLDHDLRWGAGYEPKRPQTHFSFPDDHGSFAYAANRCVGTGKCRKHAAGTMCPSYMATKEESYSTRGRARLLFEMLANDSTDGWRDETIKDALEFCLACKACKSECPVNVDMATYKAEFLSHYYERRVRPVHAYAFGLMMWWARAAALAPRLANAVANAPLVGSVLKAAIGMSSRREPPLFARETFRQWFAARAPRAQREPRVVLWPDTWNDHFHPETLRAAVEVLEDARFTVVVPQGAFCCGRPLYDYGMLGLAKSMLLECISVLREEVRAGTYVVVLEPSCASVFREELNALIPNDEDAQRIAKNVLALEDFLAEHAPAYRTPKLLRRAVVHQHCHRKAVMASDGQSKLFSAMGLECERPDTGCCGMAGAFGFEREHYDVSMKCGERVLLPEVREASAQTLVVADGFSCREQIAQSTGRQALHPAEVLHMAIDRTTPQAEPLPERRYRDDPEGRRREATLTGAALLTATLLAAALVIIPIVGKRTRKK